MKRTISFLIAFLLLINCFSLQFPKNVIAEGDGHPEDFEYDRSCAWPSYRNDNFNTAYQVPACSPDCVDLEGNSTLEEVWSFPTIGGSIFPPSLDFGRAYLGDQAGWFYCLDAFDGTLLWSSYTSFAIEVAPVLYDSGDDKDDHRKKVFYGDVRGNFYCRDAITGELLWTDFVNNAIRCSPKVYGGRVFFATDCGRVYCYNANLNFVLQHWVFNTGNPLARIRGTLAIGFDRIWFGASNNKLNCLINILGIPAVPIGWPVATGSYVESAPVYDNGFIYYCATNLYCINAFSGFVHQVVNQPPRFITHPAVEPRSPLPSMLYAGASDLRIKKYSTTPITTFLSPIAFSNSIPAIFNTNSSPSLTQDIAFVTTKTASQHQINIYQPFSPVGVVSVPGPDNYEKLTSISIAYKNLYFCRDSCEVYCYGCRCTKKWTITIIPKYVCLEYKGTWPLNFQFEARVYDENGTLRYINPPNLDITWRIKPIPFATISGNGLFSGFRLGKWEIIAEYTYNGSNGQQITINDTAEVEIK